MGIDYLNIRHQVEKEFAISDTNHAIVEMLQIRIAKFPDSPYTSGDFRVSDWVDCIEQELVANKHKQSEQDNVLGRLKLILTDCLGVDQSEVIPEAWLQRDLGMS
ncbi:hypothetical protein OAK47_00585 [Planctomycetaceae bacterium]|jgi:hypothetical protein|nr:hypothetical protein [Planctomycetaceae bacterium]MDG2390474.1 hypothetical protein [Planctomycetaceae bacterium]